MEDLNTEKSSYGGIERFMYILLLPILFAAILAGVLLTLFGYDMKQVVYNIGRNIPIVNSIVPIEESPEIDQANPATVITENEQMIKDLTATASEKDQQISQLESSLQEKEDAIKQLESSVEKLVLQQEAITASSEEYRKQLKNLATMYANMSPSKSAPILENLTMPELVLVLYEMNTDEQGQVLAKMNPKTAADASIQLKDINESTRAEWEEKANAARDERNEKDDPESTVKLTNEELAQTFSAMTVTSAAAILLELNKTNSNKVVTILNAMDNESRSGILTAISDTSPESAASLANKLGK